MVQMLKAPSSQALGILGIEKIKQLNMVDFLTRHYGLDFSKGGISVSTPGGVGIAVYLPSNSKMNVIPVFLFAKLVVIGPSRIFTVVMEVVLSISFFKKNKEGFGNVRETLSHIEHLLWVEVEAGGCSEQPSFRLPSPSVSSIPALPAMPPMPTMQSVLSTPCVRKPYNVEER